jgi:hypothetical protein
MICHHRGDERKFAEEPEGDTETSVPGLLPKLEETLGRCISSEGGVILGL